MGFRCLRTTIQGVALKTYELFEKSSAKTFFILIFAVAKIFHNMPQAYIIFAKQIHHAAKPYIMFHAVEHIIEINPASAGFISL